MKSFVKALIFVILAFSLQGSLPAWLKIWDGKPDIVFVVLILYAVTNGSVFGALLGFFSGLCCGAAVGSCIGTFVVTRMLCGIGAGLMRGSLFSDNPVIAVCAAGGLTIFCEGVFLLSNPMPNIAHTVMKTLGEAILNAIFALVFYTVFLHIQARKKRTLI